MIRSMQQTRSGTMVRVRSAGFSLIELAITLVVIAVLAAGLLVPLVNQIASRKTSVTDKVLQDVKDALVGYASGNGRLPCPATEASNGAEIFAAGGSATNGNCATFYGFVPAVTLSINPVDDQGFAIDGWGSTQNRIRYAVSNRTVNGVANPFTSTGGMRNATIGALAGATLFYVCGSGVGVVAGTNCGTALTLTSSAPVVVWSVGANAADGGASVDEAQNPNPNGGSADVLFVSHSISDNASNIFDDVVTWIGVSTLINKMITAGQLP
jgi:prepilin-type N-terminal cleavage/methylation domain-containing protein